MNLRIWPGVALALLTACGGHGAAVLEGRPAFAPAQAEPSSVSARAVESEGSVQDILSRIKSAYARGDYDKGLALVKEILSMKSESLSVYDRIGSTYFALGRTAEALTIWEKAMQMEKNRARRKALADSIALARRSLGLGEPAAEGRPSPEGRLPPLPPKAATAPAPAPETPAQMPKPKELSAEARAEIEQLHQKGVEYYASGEYLQAAAVYMRILDLDPDNAQAKKALERLRMRQ